MNIDDQLTGLRAMARKDDALRQALLNTRYNQDPLSSFCDIAQSCGFPLSVYELVCAGEEAYAAMRRSTNGGGENSPLLDGEDDYYELFLAGLK